MKSKGILLLIHVLGSLLFLSIPVLVSPDFIRVENLFSVPPFLRDFLSYFLLLIFFYVNYFILLPKFYFNKKIVLYFSLAFVLYLISEFIPHVFIRNLLLPENGSRPHIGHGPPRWVMWMDISRHFFLFLVVMFLSLIIRINDKLKQTMRDKLDAELSYLKAQINPHFLFNTLNSIYSLALQKSDDAANAVVKLSGMMRYVLTESQRESVSLEKEINYIKDYVELQKLRLGNAVRLDFNISGNAAQKQIAPLLLIPFIENAFKHGVNAEENSEIKIEINVTESAVNLFVKNNKVNVDNTTDVKTGLGVENTKNRLILLYPDKHHLTIDDNPLSFAVSLSINI